LKIAIATDGTTFQSMIPFRYEDSSHLLIVNADTKEILQVIDTSVSQDPHEYFAREIIKWDCEAVICGSLEKPAFEIIMMACITRYYGAGMQAEEAFDHMMKNQLGFTTDFVGGSGCSGHEHHHHHSCSHQHEEDEDEDSGQHNN
jgi:predicted Fe-Mo cluster-binding NifX family protein